MSVDPKAYVDFLSSVTLERIELVNLSARRPDRSQKYLVSVRFDARRCDALDTPEPHDSTVGRFCFLFDASVLIKTEHQVDADAKELVGAQYLAEYTIDSRPVQDEFVDLFMKRNVPMNVWPYLRELTSSITQRMGVAPLLIPLLTPRGTV